MKASNQYSEDVRRYSEEHGTDIFIEYQNPDTTPERKEEILEWLFQLFRSKGTVPHVLWNDTEIEKSLITLSEVRPADVYRNGEYWFNNIGIDVLYHFFPELDDVRKVNQPMSIRDYFNDDKKLRKVLHKALSYTNSEMGVYRMFLWCGAGYCVNFRPATAKTLYEMFGKKKDCKVFDSSAGYGARLLGAHFAENVVEYLGIDPNTAKHCADEIAFLDSKFDTGTKKQVLEMGSEDFTPENFPQYQNYFDLYFTSPPYFNTEKYSEAETQSYKKFPTYAGWIKGFYQETIHNACCALKADGLFSINIFEKVPNIKELTKLFLADNGWYVFKSDKYLLRSLPGKYEDENGNPISKNSNIGMNFEPVWYARHYSQLYREGAITKEQAIEFKKRAVSDNKDIDVESIVAS